MMEFEYCLGTITLSLSCPSEILPWWFRGKNLPARRESWVQSLGREDPLEEDMATHSSILA